jgi:hypothetical protein
MKALIGLLLTVTAAYATAPCELHAEPTDSQFIVSRIRIETGDVIPPWSEESRDMDAFSRFAYRAANALHIKTRPSVVRRELLFDVGDTLRAIDIAETERNLRAYPFIYEANVFVAPSDSGYADVFVRTSDNFSFAPGFIFEGGGGGREYGVILVETNLFGLGKRLAGSYVHETFDRNGAKVTTTRWQFEYKDPRLFGSRWYGRIFAEDVTTGSSFIVGATRPYYQLTTQRSAGWNIDWSDGYRRVYSSHPDGGHIVAELLNTRLFADAWYSRRWGDPSLRPKVLGLVRWIEVDYADSLRTLDGWSPRDTLRTSRQTVELSVSPSIESFRSYRKRHHLDDFLVVEDVREGWETGMTFGLGMPSEPTDKMYGIGGVYGEWSGITGTQDDHIVAANASVSWNMWRDSGFGRRAWSNLITRAWMRWYYQGFPYQTLATSVNWYSGERMDPPFQTILGGFTGLRGYPVNRFAGTRKLLINVENRIFPGWRVLTGVFGFVVFADAGYVWDHDESIDLTDLRSNIGFGMRVGNTRAATGRIARLDVAYAMRGQRGFYIAFGAEQIFDLFNVRPTPTR